MRTAFAVLVMLVASAQAAQACIPAMLGSKQIFEIQKKQSNKQALSQDEQAMLAEFSADMTAWMQAKQNAFSACTNDEIMACGTRLCKNLSKEELELYPHVELEGRFLLPKEQRKGWHARYMSIMEKWNKR